MTIDATGSDRRTAIVTGAGGEIGSAISRRLAREGWTVIACDLDKDAADATAAQIVGDGLSAEPYAADVTSIAEVARLIEYTLSRHRSVGALVNNVGVEGAVEPVASYPEDEFQRVMRVNVHGVFLGMRAALPVMLAAGAGTIVNTASTSAIRGRANLAGYVASKHAVLGLTRVAALEVVGTGVRVNAVLPGPIETRMIRAINEGTRALSVADSSGPAASGGSSEVRRAVATRYGTVDDVAGTVAFLTSPDSRHLNGAAVVVDAGSTVA